MNEVFKFFGTLGLDTGGAEKDLDNVTKKAKRAGEVLGNIGTAMKDTGKKLTAAITLPVVAGVAAAVKSYASLEQIVGGVEKLFDKSANAVIKNSESAYRRAGESGVDYMEQVTSFSATLLAGLNGDTVKAAEYADKAIVDMADNANTFGTNIGDVQNAYQGFAKQNYTMLDNLKLGFGGTASEMARLINESGVLGDTMEVTAETLDEVSFDQIIEAIHVVQTDMKITGTTAKEASETVSGSFDTMIAAGKNLLAGLGDANADVEVLLDVLVETFLTFAGNVKGVLLTMWDNLPMAEWQKWVGVIIVAAGPILLVLGTVVGAFSNIATAIAGASSLVGGLGAVFGALMGPVGLVVLAFAGVVAAVIGLYKTNETFREGVQSVIDKVKDFIANFDTLGERIMNSEAWDTLKGILQGIVDFWTGLFTGEGNLGETFIRIFGMVRDVAMPILNDAIAFAKSIIGQLTAFWDENGQQLMQAIQNAWQFITNVIQFFMPLIEMVITTIWNNIKGVIQGALNIIMGVLKIFIGLFTGDWSKLWEGVKQLLGGALEFIYNLWNLMMIGKLFGGIKSFVTNALSSFKGFFTNLINAFKNGSTSISGIFTGIRTTLMNIANGIKSGVSGVFNGLWNTVKTIWNGIKTAITNPIQTAKNTISGIVNAIKGLFNFKITWPKIPMPSFGISPAGWGIGDLLKGSIPKLAVSWNAKGGIFNEPTIFDTAKGLQGVGEAGPEAIIPLDRKTLGGIGAGIADTMNFSTSQLQEILYQIKDLLLEMLDRDDTVVVQLDGYTIARVTRDPMDRELGKKSRDKNQAKGRK